MNKSLKLNKSLDSILLTINITLAILWIYQGLVPKIINHVIEEYIFWEFTGIEFLSLPTLVNISGIIEICFGILFLFFRKSQFLHLLNIVGLILLAGVVVVIYPQYFFYAFNPFVMNLGMIILSVVSIRILKLNSSI